MSSFDTRLNIVAVQAQGLATDPQEPEALTAVEILLVNAMMIPGPEGQIPLPIGQYKFGIAKRDAEGLVKQLQDVIDQLVDPKPRSKIQVATDLRAATEAADRVEQLRG